MALFRRRQAATGLLPAPPDEGLELPIEAEELAVLHDPTGQVSEQYRRLRHSIQTLNPEGAPRTLLITSSVRGEGKTIASLNLALALAELPHMRVCVVDSDLRYPSVERYLGLPRRQGLTEVLRGRLPLDQAVRRTSREGVSIIGAGERHPNPSEIIGHDRARTVMHHLKRNFDYVLIDGPPALALSDASLLGAMTDGVLLVVRLGVTPRHMVEESYHLLETLGGNILGTCLTGAEETYKY
jgi:capsular exopolysaccharide synthesis family protein